MQNWAWGRGALDMQNPLWMMHRNVQNNKRRRSMMNASLTYKVTDWLTLAGRAKADLSVGESSRKLYASTDPLFAGGDNGFFEFTKEEDTHRYGDFIATVNKTGSSSRSSPMSAPASPTSSPASPERAVRSNCPTSSR